MIRLLLELLIKKEFVIIILKRSLNFYFDVKLLNNEKGK